MSHRSVATGLTTLGECWCCGDLEQLGYEYAGRPVCYWCSDRPDALEAKRASECREVTMGLAILSFALALASGAVYHFLKG